MTTRPLRDTRGPSAALAGAFDLASHLAAAARWAARGHERWRQRQALAALDDRLLDDVGITRARALEEARRPFWR